MRILIDQENLDWDQAWEITKHCMGYTNHTLMPEALEKWTVPMMQEILPRHMQIIYEINARFIRYAMTYFPMDPKAVAKVSIIEESSPKAVRLAEKLYDVLNMRVIRIVNLLTPICVLFAFMMCLQPVLF